MLKDYQIGSCVLDKWTIKSILGEGSFGKVFEIERTEYGETYRAALKVITVPQNDAELQSALNEGMTMEQAKNYFFSVVQDIVREFAIMSKMKGTANVVSYEDHAVLSHSDGIGWDILIRMELLHPLLNYAYSQPMARRDIIKLGIDICKALELCQKYNVIHRDIKPENIFISDNGDYKLGDFGIARTIERTSAAMSKKGTYQYMAPEVYRGHEYGFNVDTYSLGLVLYRMLNKNRVPFMPPAPEAITYANREEALARRLSGETLPRPIYAEGRLGEIVLKAASPLPANRYDNPGLMRQELENILYEEQDASLIYPDGDEITLERNRYHSKTASIDAVQTNRTVSLFGNVKASPVIDSLEPQSNLNEDSTEGTIGVFGRKTSYTVPTSKKKKATFKLKTKIIIAVASAAVVAGTVIGIICYQNAQRNKVERYQQALSTGMDLCQTDPEQALLLFQEAQMLFPEEPAPYASYGYALYCAGRFEDCIHYIEDDLALGKQYDIETQSRLSEILGAAYFECDDYAQAASFFRLSTAGGDLTVPAQRDYAVSLGRLGDVAAADEVLEGMYAAGADDDVTDYVSAEVAFAREEYVEAERGFEIVLETTEDVVLQKRALRSLAEVYRDCAALVRQDKSPIHAPATKAVEVLSNGIETFGLRYDATLWEMLALAYFEAYHTDVSTPQSYLRKSAECFDRVIELGVTKDYFYSNLFTLYFELEDYEAAEKNLKAYEEKYPEHYEPHAFRAMMLIEMENGKNQRDYSKAVEEYEIAGSMIRGDDDATYYQQLESLIQTLQREGWIA